MPGLPDSQPPVHLGQVGVPAQGGHRRHVQEPSRPRPSAPDEGPALRVPDSRGTAASPARLAAALPLRAPSSGISASRPAAVVAAIPGMEVRIKLAGPRLVGRNQLLHFAVDGPQVALEHVDLGLVLLFEKGFAELLAAVEQGRALADQRVPGRLQFLEPVAFWTGPGSGRIHGGHLGQFPSVYGVGLGAAPGRGETSGLPGVHLANGSFALDSSSRSRW